MREVDVVARYGGEEFLVVLPSTHFGGAVTVAEEALITETDGAGVYTASITVPADAPGRSASKIAW